MAGLVLLSWPLIALTLFARLPVLLAIIWSVVLPYLFLPEAFEIVLSGLPDIDKTAIISIALFMGLIVYRQKVDTAFPKIKQQVASPALRRLLLLCTAVFIIGACLTVMTNLETLRFGPVIIEAARPWDVIGVVSTFFLTWFPFWCATKFLATPNAHRALLIVLVLAVLGYSLLILFEIRFSPQLHRWIYGYHQHSFLQHVRDGFRPMVFLQHGLWVGFLLFTGLMAAVGLWKSSKQPKWAWAAVWIFVILVISKNLGAVTIAILMLAIFLGMPQRLQRWSILTIVVAVLFFPAVRQAQILPSDRVLSFFSEISTARANSLEFRLNHEDLLIEKALEKPFFGWGGWGRGQIYSEDGRDISVSEGRWIQILSVHGWVGYVAFFGLLTLPLIFLSTSKHLETIPIETMALALIGTGNLIYMIPNSTMTPVGLLVYGAVAGFVIHGNKQNVSQTSESKTRAARSGRYTRFGSRVHKRA